MLEVRVASMPQDTPARLELANAYRGAGRAEEAVALVRPVLASDAAHPEALFQLGLAEEALGRIPEARLAYERFLEVSPSPRLSRHVRARMVLLRRMEVTAAVREAVRMEATLGDAEPEPGTLGIFPLLVGADDETLQPLGTALAVLLATDMSQTDRLRVLERVQIQALLAEISLGQTARVDPATAARAGRILSAGRIIQGRVEGAAEALRLEAYAVPVARAVVSGDPVRSSGALATLFDMEKELALGLYEAMGIQLTPAERERVLQRPTANVQALLAFGLALEASDGFRFREALGHLEAALAADPDFALAREEHDLVRDLVEAEGESLEELEELAWWEFGPSGIPWRHPRERFGEVDAIIPLPEGNPPLEGLGAGLDRRGRVDIIVPRPGGN
jgi:tetratricopeptide (TPR) repeat protein